MILALWVFASFVLASRFGRWIQSVDERAQ